MAIQTMGLDYGWLVNLADVISRARQQPTSARAAARPAPEKTRHQLKEEQRREDLLATEQRKHEVTMKQMELESGKATALAKAMSAERIAGVGAEAGVEVAEIGAAGQVAAAQKTTMEKGYEFVDMLFKMDKPSRDELITTLEAKREERRAMRGERPTSTITSGGETISLPGATAEADPDDPLTLLEGIGAYNPETGVIDPKPTGEEAKNQVEELLDLVDDYIGGDLAMMADMFSKPGGTERLMERIDAIGIEAGYSTDVIDSVKEIYRAMAGPPREEPPEEGGGLGGAIRGALTPFGVGREELPPEAAPGAEMYLGGAGAFKEGAPKVEKAPGFAKTMEDFIETIITGPFYPAYKEWKGKRTDKVVKTEKKEEVTEQDIITEMGTWGVDKVKEFQTIAAEAGLYKGAIDGKISHALEDALRKYYKEHKEEWE